MPELPELKDTNLPRKPMISLRNAQAAQAAQEFH